MDELDYKLEIDSHGLEVHKEGLAINNNIEEWLDTPEGTVANNPAWGHNLKPLQFEPDGEETSILIEMAISQKLPLDVRGLRIVAVRVYFPEFDKCQVVIQHQYGKFDKTVAR